MAEVPGRAAYRGQRETLVRRALGRRWPEALAAAVGRWIFDFPALAALEAAGARPNLALALLRLHRSAAAG